MNIRAQLERISERPTLCFLAGTKAIYIEYLRFLIQYDM